MIGVEPKFALAVASTALIILSFGSTSKIWSWTLRVMGTLFGIVLISQLDTSNFEFYMPR